MFGEQFNLEGEPYYQDVIQLHKNLNPLPPEPRNDCCQHLGEDPWCRGQTKWKCLKLIGLSEPVESQELVVS